MAFFKTSDGISLNFQDRGGQGPVVLLVSGFSGIQAEWQYQAQKLIDLDYRVITMDWRSHGRSERTTKNLRISRLAADLHELMTILDLNDVTLVGHSMGGSAIWAYLSLFGQERLKQLVIVDESPKLLNEDGWTAGIRDLDFNSFNSLAPNFLKQKLTFTPVSSTFKEFLRREKNAAPFDFDLAYPLLKDHLLADWRENLKDSTLPTLFVAGKESPLCKFGYYHDVESLLNQQSTMIVIDHAGHLPHIELPEEFNHYFFEFVQTGAVQSQYVQPEPTPQSFPSSGATTAQPGMVAQSQPIDYNAMANRQLSNQMMGGEVPTTNGYGQPSNFGAPNPNVNPATSRPVITEETLNVTVKRLIHFEDSMTGREIALPIEQSVELVGRGRYNQTDKKLISGITWQYADSSKTQFPAYTAPKTIQSDDGVTYVALNVNSALIAQAPNQPTADSNVTVAYDRTREISPADKVDTDREVTRTINLVDVDNNNENIWTERQTVRYHRDALYINALTNQIVYSDWLMTNTDKDIWPAYQAPDLTDKGYVNPQFGQLNEKKVSPDTPSDTATLIYYHKTVEIDDNGLILPEWGDQNDFQAVPEENLQNLKKAITRTISYRDSQSQDEIADAVRQEVVFQRKAVYDYLTKEVSHFSSWMTDNSVFDQVISPDLSSQGYGQPNPLEAPMQIVSINNEDAVFVVNYRKLSEEQSSVAEAENSAELTTDAQQTEKVAESGNHQSKYHTGNIALDLFTLGVDAFPQTVKHLTKQPDFALQTLATSLSIMLYYASQLQSAGDDNQVSDQSDSSQELDMTASALESESVSSESSTHQATMNSFKTAAEIFPITVKQIAHQADLSLFTLQTSLAIIMFYTMDRQN